jgi:hypothetical protein
VSTPITRVTGGVDGVAASYAAMLALADRFGAAATRLREVATADARVLVCSDLVESAPLSPVTFAEAEARVVEATSGPWGAVEAAAMLKGDALLVRGMVAAYRDCDSLVETSFTVLDHQVGQAAGAAARFAAPGALLPALLAVPAWNRLPLRMRRRLGTLVDGRLEAEIDAHPEATQHAVDATGGLLDGLLGLPPSHLAAPDAAADVARLYPAEHAPVVRRRDDLATPLGRVPPADLAGLLRHLEQTNAISPPDRPDDQGTIEVQTLHGPDGRLRYVVYLPGTDDPGVAPWSHESDARDLPADLRSEAGQPTAYAVGIERAMTEAGIGRHDPVLLVGHSLGGMEAASLLAHGSPFHLTHVVTAGSPIGGIHHYPPGTHVLSLENRGDVVPLLDGRDNADSVRQVTVQFDDPGTTVIGSHALRHYVHGAASADASGDPAVREQLTSLRAHGFLGSDDRATSQVFQIVR